MEPHIRDIGHAYRDGKVAGRPSGFEFYDEAFYVMRTSVMGALAPALGGAARGIGKAADSQMIANAKQDGNLEEFTYRDVVEMRKGFSLAHMTAVTFTMRDGRVIKLKPKALVGSFYKKALQLVLAVNPAVQHN